MAVAAILKGKTVHPGVSLTVTPGTKQVYSMIAQNGALADLIAAGARILESACGPCIGMGQAPGHRRASPCAPSTATSRAAAARPTPRSTWPARRPARRRPCRRHHRPAQPGRARRRGPCRRTIAIDDNMIVPPPADRSRGGDRPRPQHQAGAGAPSRSPTRCAAGAAQGRRQHHHRPHHARAATRCCRCAPTSRPSPSTASRRWTRGFAQRAPRSGRRLRRRRRQLRPGLQPRARRARSHVPGRQGGASPSPSPASTRPIWSTWASCR